SRLVQITSDIELSGAGCTTAITPNQLVQSSSENDSRRFCRKNQEFRDKLIAPRNAKPRCRPLSEVPHGQALDTLLTCL
ncbi:hypothetical protein, partial [Enterobacter roggenkampii]|uniref:hypothetical protein n=1 Tax=Enterobacter roggenkampii TaxID=1812935 RepID=UPI00200611DE